LSLADAFLNASREKGQIGRVASKFSARTSAEEWEFFISAITSQLSDAARASGRGRALKGPLAGLGPVALLEGWEQVCTLAARGDALNLDRSQLVTAMAYDLRRTFEAR
jgi:hypothetical protein